MSSKDSASADAKPGFYLACTFPSISGEYSYNAASNAYDLHVKDSFHVKTPWSTSPPVYTLSRNADNVWTIKSNVDKDKTTYSFTKASSDPSKFGYTLLKKTLESNHEFIYKAFFAPCEADLPRKWITENDNGNPRHSWQLPSPEERAPAQKRKAPDAPQQQQQQNQATNPQQQQQQSQATNPLQQEKQIQAIIKQMQATLEMAREAKKLAADCSGGTNGNKRPCLSPAPAASGQMMMQAQQMVCQPQQKQQQPPSAASSSQQTRQQQIQKAPLPAAGSPQQAQKAPLSAAGSQQQAQKAPLSAAGSQQQAQKAPLSAAGSQQQPQKAPWSAAGSPPQQQKAPPPHPASAAGSSQQQQKAPPPHPASAAGSSQQQQKAPPPHPASSQQQQKAPPPPPASAASSGSAKLQVPIPHLPPTSQNIRKYFAMADAYRHKHTEPSYDSLIKRLEGEIKTYVENAARGLELELELDRLNGVAQESLTKAIGLDQSLHQSNANILSSTKKLSEASQKLHDIEAETTTLNQRLIQLKRDKEIARLEIACEKDLLAHAQEAVDRVKPMAKAAQAQALADKRALDDQKRKFDEFHKMSSGDRGTVNGILSEIGHAVTAATMRNIQAQIADGSSPFGHLASAFIAKLAAAPAPAAGAAGAAPALSASAQASASLSVSAAGAAPAPSSLSVSAALAPAAGAAPAPAAGAAGAAPAPVSLSVSAAGAAPAPVSLSVSAAGAAPAPAAGAASAAPAPPPTSAARPAVATMDPKDMEAAIVLLDLTGASDDA